jgi:hypothetical protein
MKLKAMIVLAIIFGLATVILSWVSASDRFAIELPWILTISPSIIFTACVLIPYAAQQGKKNKKDE